MGAGATSARAGVRACAGVGAGRRAGCRCAGARGAQSGRRQRARHSQQAQAGCRPRRAGRAAWAFLCVQAGRAG